MPAQPRYSVCQFSTPDLTFEEDLDLYARTGATGVGIWEGKLRDGEEEQQGEALRARELEATVCIPKNIGPLPVDGFPGPSDVDERIEAMCDSIRRLGRFAPATVVVVTGADRTLSASDQRRIVVEGLREAARTAAAVGTRLSVEPIRDYEEVDLSVVHTLPDTLELIDEIGEANVGIAYDVYHLFDTDNVLELTERHSDAIAGVHVCDYRRGGPRTTLDRVLPGDGVIDLTALFSALESGGYSGWYDLEVFSDKTFPDSLWNLPPEEMLTRGHAGFLQAWNAAVAVLEQPAAT